MALYPTGSLPPSQPLSVVGGNDIAAASRSVANEYTLLLEEFSGKTKTAYQNAIGWAGLIPKTTMNGFQSEQFLYTSRIDADYKAPGQYFLANDGYRKTERTVTPDKPTYAEEALYGYDLQMSQIPDTSIVSREIGLVLSRIEEVKALKAAAKACLGNAQANGSDNFAVYLGGDGTTDYGLAANRTETLTGLTTTAALYASDGVLFHKALAGIAAKIWDFTAMSPASQGYRFIATPFFYEWMKLSDEFKVLLNRDFGAVTNRYGSYLGELEGMDIEGIPLSVSGLAAQVLGQNVTYGWKTGGTAGDNEPDVANKYTSDNSKLVGMVIAPDALHAAQVQGTMVDLWESKEADAIMLRGKTDAAFKPVDEVKAFAVILDT